MNFNDYCIKSKCIYTYMWPSFALCARQYVCASHDFKGTFARLVAFETDTI